MGLDYKELEFKCGIEIHQQLEGKKLFCSCPTIIRDDKPDIKVKRRLRATVGELGKIDIAAMYEQKKDKYFLYHAYSDTTCLVELDEEPPHPINKQAVHTAVKVAMLLNAKIVDEIQIMRKTVIDGSNTTGFQRTSLIARNGFINTSEGKIRIPTICLEEEAAKIIARTRNYDIYNLSRLGIPLIEIGTAADIKSPKHAREVAEKIGLILRSVKGIKRGLGTIRQDVNISIKRGVRIEIKGFQDYRNIPKVIENEVLRQLELIKQKKKILEEVRKVKPDGTTEFLRPMPGAARMYPETDILPLKTEIKEIKLPELIEKRAEKFQKKYSLSKDLAKKISKSELNELFEELVKENKNIKPGFIAETLVSYTREIIRNYKGNPSLIKKDHLKTIFKSLNHEKISKESIIPILVNIASGREFNLSTYTLISDKVLKQELKKIVNANKELPFNMLIGKAMAKLRGKSSGKKIAEELKKLIKT